MVTALGANIVSRSVVIGYNRKYTGIVAMKIPAVSSPPRRFISTNNHMPTPTTTRMDWPRNSKQTGKYTHNTHTGFTQTRMTVAEVSTAAHQATFVWNNYSSQAASIPPMCLT